MADLEIPGKELQSKLLAAFGSSPDSLYKDEHIIELIKETNSAKETSTTEPAARVLQFDDRNPNISEGVRFFNALAALLVNCDDNLSLALKPVGPQDIDETGKPRTFEVLSCYSNLLQGIARIAELTDERLCGYLDLIYHDTAFQQLEAAWRGLDDLASSVSADDVVIDFLDVSKSELGADLIDHELDVFGSELFKKIYVQEYDRYGGKPFAAMIGLYEFDSSDDDIKWLTCMGKVANASHCPFVGAASPRFFGRERMDEVAQIEDLDAELAHPRYGRWQELRTTDYAAYLGLVLPRYLLRGPFGCGPTTEARNTVGYHESVLPNDIGPQNGFLWGNAATLFAKNMVKSYEGSGWAQHIRGPRGGGLVQGLTVYTYEKNGYPEVLPPVEIAIPDYRELQFANNGFIPLVHKKNEAVATFFSAQSIKKPRTFVEDLSTKNAHLVTNLAYTFSITRIAHYVKRTMREYIGSVADGPYIQQTLAAWLGRFVTTVTNPDDLTLRYYPFKAVDVAVEPKPGPFGWYKATVSALPHAQFEGMDVELRLEAALGGP
jgi:type VI secretion system protein ImpC